MLGIKEIASYVPNERRSNYELMGKFDVGSEFLEKKIGVRQRAIKGKQERASDMCVKAFEALVNKTDIDLSQIDCCVVVTQTPDFNIPHTSAIVHGKLGLKENCACFDISLGCSGYVYGLAVVISFMEANNLRHGLLFTSDPYSEIVDENDKNTALLFGDASTVTYIGEEPKFTLGKTLFGTWGKEFDALIKKEKLSMNGRSVFNFTVLKIPEHIKRTVEENNLKMEDIDLFLLHPGSKYIVDMIVARTGIDKSRVPFEMYDYGNTVSSSIPLMLENRLDKNDIRYMLLSGYGVGLSWATTVLRRERP